MMEVRPQIPTPLKVVAYLFILGGVLAVLEVLMALLHSSINLNFGVLGLFVGPGLLRLSRGWRTCGLVLIWIGMVGIAIVGVLMLGYSGPIDFTLFGAKVGYVPKGVGVVMCMLLFGLLVWEYYVLTRPDVRRLFGLETG
ncbi:MAG: hypothetical protein GY851_33150 [bacterium]|nr:hypothetical protein [bacterium]